MPKVSIPTPRVNLRKKVTTDKSGILFLTFRTNGKVLSYSTGHKIDSEYWDAKKHRTKFNKKYGQSYIDINTHLADLTKFVNSTYQKNTEITVSELRTELDYFTGKAERPRADGKEHLSFFKFLDLFVEEQKATAKRGTWKKFVTLKNHLSLYVTDTGNEISFSSINWEFRAKFLKWLYSEPRNHSQNTAAKTIKNLKQVLNDATRRNYNENLTFKDSGFSVKTIKTKNKIRLTFAEIHQLIKYDLSHNPRLERTRDLFIVGCFTGLRFSDWHKVGQKNIIKDDGIDLLEIMTEKTDTLVIIPFLPELKNILNKYEYNLPTLSLTNFNVYIKEVLQAVGIDTNFLRIYSESGDLKTERLEKWKGASSHAARRSFATNFYDLGIPAVLLMQITGHSTEKQFFEYIDVNQYEMAKKFAREVMMKRAATALKVVSN